MLWPSRASEKNYDELSFRKISHHEISRTTMPCFFFEGHAVQQKLSTVHSHKALCWASRWILGQGKICRSRRQRSQESIRCSRSQDLYNKLGVGDPKMIQHDHETIGIMIQHQNYIDNDDQPSDSWGSAFLKRRS